ncbi:MAG: hypothetical protein RMJ55_07015, partial [Roseiflexaceae bacterium]|nr:hypothetical protein [Roseiflexaceae bacterium]
MRLLNIGLYRAVPFAYILWHRGVVVAAAIIALLATTLFVATTLPETITYRTEELGAKADGFWAPEFNGERFYRWTQDVAHFDFPAFDGTTQFVVALSLSAPQRPNAPSVAATITAGARISMHFDIAPEWRTYHVLIDTGSSHWRTPSFKLTTATWRAPRDERDLGILVSHLTAHRLFPSYSVVIERWLFLSSLVALIALATRDVRPTGIIPLGALATLAGLALLTPARLVQWTPVNWWLVIGLTVIVLIAEGIRRYHPRTLERINRMGLSIALGVAWTLTSITHVLAPRLTGAEIMSLLLVTGLMALYSALAYRLIRSVIPRLQTFGRNAQIAWLLGALLLGVLATLVIPTFPPPLWHAGEGSIMLLDVYDSAEYGNGVWILRVIQGVLWTADIISFGVSLASALLLLSAWQ